MVCATARHVSMIDEFTDGLQLPENLPDEERHERLKSHVIGCFAAKGVERDTATDAFRRWRRELRQALSLCEKPGQEPEIGWRLQNVRWLIDGRTGLVLGKA